MPISRISISSSVDNSVLHLDLNVIQKGWVAQIIEGTFANSTKYSFTDGNLTSVESSSIDIHVRLTPVVSITERTPEEILSFLGRIGKNSSVTLTDTDIPYLYIKYVKNNNNTYTATLEERPNSIWTQNCLVREIKYNYSENPATIEFTISTTKPYLKGSTLDFYYRIGDTSDSEASWQFSRIFRRLLDLNVYGDLEGFAISTPAGSKGSSKTIKNNNFPYVIFIKTGNPSKACEIRLQERVNGDKYFLFEGGSDKNASYGYVTEANPIFDASIVKYIIENHGRFSSKIQAPLGQVSTWARFVQLKRGL